MLSLRVARGARIAPRAVANGALYCRYAYSSDSQSAASASTASAATASTASTSLDKQENAAPARGKLDVSSMRQVFRLARPEWKSLTASIGLLSINTSVNMLLPFSMGKVIDYITIGSVSAERVQTTVLVLGGAFAMSAVAGGVRTYLMKMSGERIVNDLRRQVYASLLRQEMGFFDTQRTGELINRLSSDTQLVGKTLTNNIADGLRTMSQAVIGSALMMVISPPLTLTILSIVPPLALVGVFYGRYVRKLTKQTQDALADTTKIAEERISGIRTVRANGREEAEIERYAEKTFEILRIAKKEALASGGFYGLANFMGNASMLAVLWYGGSMVMSGAISIGDLSTFLLYTVYVGGSVVGISSFYSELMKGVGAGARVFELRDRVPEVYIGANKRLDELRGHIEFRNVQFAYPSRSSAGILKDLNLTIEPGTITAIVGQSGSGKSTIGSLLMRLYDPQAGHILVDGVDIRDLNLTWFRDHMALVSQEPVLFADTIQSNIAYGSSRDHVSDDVIIDAANRANASTFINNFPAKYETYVGERGISLSGGQKQRIAISRALLKNPKILILDEATSALDAESEGLVQEALDRLMVGRTVIIIAHRMSTIRGAGKIAVLKEGKIVEVDTYENLMRNDTYFKRTIARTIKE